MRMPEQIEAMVPISDRSAQRFPRLRDAQLDVVKRFANAEARTFAPREPIFQIGDRCVPAWFLLEGSTELFGRDGLDQEIALRQLESGQFTGELHQLSDRPTLAGAVAGPDGCVALPLDAARLRALIVGSAELSLPAEDLPLLICSCGRVLKRPSNEEAGPRMKRRDLEHAGGT